MTAGDLIRAKVLSRAGVYFLLDGTTKADKVRETTVGRLCKVLGVNVAWLTQGRGPRDTLAHGEKVLNPADETVPASHFGRLDEGMLWVAELLTVAMEAQHGKLPPRRRVKELARQYNRLADAEGIVGADATAELMPHGTAEPSPARRHKQ